jgi:hypothetical protein
MPNRAYAFGLNIPVPSGGAGVNVDVLGTYSPVGIAGVPSETLSVIRFAYVKYSFNGVTSTFCVPSYAPGGGSCANTMTTSPVDANIMSLVGSKPASITLIDSSSALANGSVKIASVAVSAHSQGAIAMNELPINVLTLGNVTIPSGTNNIIVKNASNNSVIPTTNNQFAVLADSNNTITIVFTGGYTIPAGASVTFDLYATAANVIGQGSNRLQTLLGTSDRFRWTDVAGNGQVARNSAIIIPNYPTNASEIFY